MIDMGEKIKRYKIFRLEKITEENYTKLINRNIYTEYTTPLKKDINIGTYTPETTIFYAVSDKIPKGYIYEFFYDNCSEYLTLYKAHTEEIFDNFIKNPSKDNYLTLSADWDTEMRRGYDEFGNYNEFFADEEARVLSHFNNLEFAKHYSAALKTEEIEPEIDL